MSVPIDRRSEAIRIGHNKARAKAVGLPATLTLEEWLDIIERFGGKCAYCEEQVFDTLDHLIPLSASGGTVADNCLPVCTTCNTYKGSSSFDMSIDLPLEAKLEQVRTILRTRRARKRAKTGNEVLIKPRPRRTPLGTIHVNFTFTSEVIAALEQIREESDGKSTSRFVDDWLREHPQVKAELEAQQEGVEQHG